MEYIVHDNKWVWGRTMEIIYGGGIGVVQLEFENDQPHAFLSGLCVLEPHRGKGIGRTLLQMAECIAVDNCRTAVELEVEADARPLIEMYSRHGYKYAYEYVSDTGGCEHSYWGMRKELHRIETPAGEE